MEIMFRHPSAVLRCPLAYASIKTGSCGLGWGLVNKWTTQTWDRWHIATQGYNSTDYHGRIFLYSSWSFSKIIFPHYSYSRWSGSNVSLMVTDSTNVIILWNKVDQYHWCLGMLRIRSLVCISIWASTHRTIGFLWIFLSLSLQRLHQVLQQWVAQSPC